MTLGRKKFVKNIMTLERMGARYPSRLSFSRSMLRAMVKEKWKIKKSKFDLDKNGFGTAVYEVNTLKGIYSLICFANKITDQAKADLVRDVFEGSYLKLVDTNICSISESITSSWIT